MDRRRYLGRMGEWRNHHDGTYHSRTVAGFRLRPDWLWAEPLPKVLDVARELGLLD